MAPPLRRPLTGNGARAEPVCLMRAGDRVVYAGQGEPTMNGGGALNPGAEGIVTKVVSEDLVECSFNRQRIQLDRQDIRQAEPLSAVSRPGLPLGGLRRRRSVGNSTMRPLAGSPRNHVRGTLSTSSVQHPPSPPASGGTTPLHGNLRHGRSFMQDSPGQLHRGRSFTAQAQTKRAASCSRIALPNLGGGKVTRQDSTKGPDLAMSIEGSSLNARPTPAHRSVTTGLLSPPASARSLAAVAPALSGEPEKQHPASFYCPISRQCMHDPVVLTDGHTYERRHIERWLREHNTSPVSGARLESTHTFPNHALRNAIEEYFEKILRGHRKAIQTTIQGLKTAGKGNRRVSNELLGTIDSLMQCSILVNADLTLERALKGIMDEARNLVGAEVASVFLVDEERQELYSTVNSTGSELRIPISTGIAGRVASVGAPIIVKDAYCDERFNTAIDEQTGFKTRNIMCVPVQSWKWGIIGVAQLINKTNGGILTAVSGTCDARCEKAQHFTEDDQHFFQVLASQAAVAVVNSGFFEQERGLEAGLGGLDSRRPSKQSLSVSKVFSDADLEVGGLRRNSASKASVCRTASLCDSPLGTPKNVLTVQEPDACDPALARPLLAQALGGWELDTLALAEFTGERPLSSLLGHLLEKLGLLSYFNLSSEKLSCFMTELERGYTKTTHVQYHNRAHAASVLHFTYALWEMGGVAEVAARTLTGVEDGERCRKLALLAGLFAAAIHDYEHVGLSNDFMVKSFSERALRFNDKSVNESHHVAAAFEVLHRPECNFLEGLPLGEYRQLRSMVIDLVLATDMAENGNILKRFQDFLSSASSENRGAEDAMKQASKQELLVAMQVALKCADLGHLALSWNLHVRWVRRLEQEFFTQGDREKESNLHESVSFLMDREKPGVTQSQVGFFDFVVLPLYRMLAKGFPKAQPMLSAVEANYKRWQAIESTTEEA